MWQDLVDQKEKWIGGRLIDYGDSMDRMLMHDEDVPIETVITGFKLTDEWFGVEGEDFNCGGNRQYMGITRHPQFPMEGPGLVVSGYGGHEWHIIPKEVSDGMGKV